VYWALASKANAMHGREGIAQIWLSLLPAKPDDAAAFTSSQPMRMQRRQVVIIERQPAGRGLLP
jgi:hypothetical protein